MGKARKVSKGDSTGFVPNYRLAVETIAESEGFGSSGNVDEESTTSQGSCGHNRKSIGSNADSYNIFNVPFQYLKLSDLPPLERRNLEVMLKFELEQVRKLRNNVGSFNLDVSSYQNGAHRPAMVENLPTSTSDVPMSTGKKKSAPGRNGPRTKGGPASVKKNESSSSMQSLPHGTGSFMLLKQCETLLTRLMGQQYAWVFNEPVDIVKHNIPDYFNIIKHPMDLGTVKRKLVSNQYSNPMEFAADVRLTFKNAMTYNPRGHDVHYMAEVMSKYFEMRWKAIEKKIPPTADESTPSKSSIVIEPESAYVPPAKKQKTKTVEKKVKKERERPVMSDDEKQKLGVELEASLVELPDNFINFLKECTSHGGTGEEEIEIDMDSLNDDTLFTIRKLLDDFLLDKQKNQAVCLPSEIEVQKESGLSNLSVLPCKGDELVNEEINIDRNDPPPLSGSPMKIDKVDDQRTDVHRSNSSSDSGSSSSDTDSEDSSASETNIAKNSISSSAMNVTEETKEDHKESMLIDSNNGDFSNEQTDQNHASNSSTELNYRDKGENARPERQVSPDKLYRAALLRSRFADIIIKAQENSVDKGEKPDTERLKLEKEEVERRRREEKARLQAEAKAAEEARKKAEMEAAAEAKRKRELEREAARQALQKMEKTVDINENNQFIEDLEMFKSRAEDRLLDVMEEASPESCENSFKFPASGNPLEQLGLFMKNDEEEEEEEEEEVEFGRINEELNGSMVECDQ